MFCFTLDSNQDLVDGIKDYLERANHAELVSKVIGYQVRVATIGGINRLRCDAYPKLQTTFIRIHDDVRRLAGAHGHNADDEFCIRVARAMMMCHPPVPRVPPPAAVHHHHRPYWSVWLLLVLIVLMFAVVKAYGQQSPPASSLPPVFFWNNGVKIAHPALNVNCSTNLTCSWNAGTRQIDIVSGAGGGGLADPGGNGLVVRTGLNITINRSVGATGPITVSNADGTAGDPTLACPTCVTNVTGTAPVVSSGGTTPAISCPTCATTSSATTVNTQTCTLGSTCTVSGTENTQTTNYTATATDFALSRRIVMNCAGACALTLPNPSPANGEISVVSVGAVTATIALNSRSYNGATVAPTLYNGQLVLMTTDGTNYFGGFSAIPEVVTLFMSTGGLSTNTAGQTAQEFGNDNGLRSHMDFSNVSQIRLSCRVRSVTSPTGTSTIFLQYSTDTSQTDGTPSPAFAVLTSNSCNVGSVGTKFTNWENIPSGARTASTLVNAFFTNSGGTTGSVALAAIQAQLR